MPDTQRELLAAYAHEAWSGWMKWMIEHGGVIKTIELETGYWPQVWIMLPEKFERWQRQMNTSYEDLPEEEKQSDRDEADKIRRLLGLLI